MPYKYVIFDMDGTLCDPGPSITDSVKFALVAMGVAESGADTLRKFVGPPLTHSFQELYGFDDDQTKTAIALYRKNFQAEGIRQYIAYSGVVELLGQLRSHGRVLSVATSKADKFTHQILTNTGLIDYFEVVAAPNLSDVTARKADTIRRAMAELGEPSHSDVVMVGDRAQDIEGAQKNKLASIGVLYGYGDRSELEAAGATHIVGTVGEMGQLLDGFK